MWSGWPPGEGRRGILEEAWVPASTGAAADAGAAAETGSKARGSGSEAHGQRARSAQCRWSYASEIVTLITIVAAVAVIRSEA